MRITLQNRDNPLSTSRAANVEIYQGDSGGGEGGAGDGNGKVELKVMG